MRGRSRRGRPAAAIALGLVVALAALVPLPAAGAPDEPVQPVGGATEAAADLPVHLTLPLARDEEGLAAYAASEEPRLGTEEVSQRFGASDATRAAVVDYFAAEGLEARIDATGIFATVTTDVATAERLFATSVVVPASPPDALTTTAPPQVPEPLVGHVDAVLGLDTVARGSAAHARALGAGGGSPTNTGTPQGCAEAVASGATTPNQWRGAYGIDLLTNESGAGVRIAVVDFQGYDLSDYQTANACFGRDAPAPVTQLVDPVTSPLPAALETTLDLQVVAGVAPSLARLDIFEGGEDLTAFPALYAAPLDPARYPDGRLPHVISSSLGQCEPDWTESLFDVMESVLAAAAAVGVTVVSAAGDHGSSGCWETSSPNTVQAVWYPASSPWVTAIGGTNVRFAPDNSIVDEVVWNDGVFTPAGATDGGGGGPSGGVTRPGFQRDVGLGGATRLVPDLAFFADLLPGYAIHCAPGVCGPPAAGWYPIGGTSAATPLFATALAMIDVQRDDLHLGPLGWLNPTIYDLARTQPQIFRDVIVGTNDLFGVGCCDARVGYDDASGWGSIAIDQLAEILAPAPTVLVPRFTG